MKDYKFRKFGGSPIEDVGVYLREYLTKNPNTSIFIGTDSDNKRGHTMYATAICMYDLDRRDGVHYIFCRDKTPKEAVIFSRMLNEVQRSVDMAEYLEKQLEGFVKRFTPEEIVKMRDENNNLYKAHQVKLCTIDIDINPFDGNGHNKSHKAFEAARSWVSGSGFRCRFKPYSWAANCAADLICKRSF
jgi:predicted RNase H-related nuclease YkuK (DUF458 family)